MSQGVLPLGLARAPSASRRALPAFGLFVGASAHRKSRTGEGGRKRDLSCSGAAGATNAAENRAGGLAFPGRGRGLAEAHARRRMELVWTESPRPEHTPTGSAVLDARGSGNRFSAGQV